MKKIKNNGDAVEIPEIIHNATVLYTDGDQEVFEAVRLTERGVVIGRLSTWNDGSEKFIEYGFIPHRNIQRITNASIRRIHRR